MKQIREIYIAARDVMHIIGFFTLAYTVIGALDIDLYVWQKIILGVFLSAIGFGIGHGYEGLRFMLFGDPTSVADGNRSWLGFTLGTIAVFINKDINFISTYMFYACLTILMIDILLAIKKINK